MKRLGPGVYSDGDTLHLVIPELLEANGWPATRANVDRLSAMAEIMATERAMAVEVHE